MQEVFSILFSLFIIEVLLSIDNALVNATIAEMLPEIKRKKAIRIGIVLGALFRVIALFFAAFIIQNVWLKVLGGIYLVYLAFSHLRKDSSGDGYVIKNKKESMYAIIWQIAIADIVFSIDNVISAVSFSEKFSIVVAGVLIGTISMLFVTPILSRLIHRYKGMSAAAYVIVALVGVSLISETIFHIHITEIMKCIIILSIIMYVILSTHFPTFKKKSL